MPGKRYFINIPLTIYLTLSFNIPSNNLDTSNNLNTHSNMNLNNTLMLTTHKQSSRNPTVPSILNTQQQYLMTRRVIISRSKLCLKSSFALHQHSCRSGRWQAPAAVLPPEGPEDKGHSHSRARRAREWPKHASPRARRARGRAKLSARFGACQCYYMFFTIQPKIAIFMAQFKYLNDGQNA